MSKWIDPDKDVTTKEVKYEDLCAPSKVRDPNTGELVSSDADFVKPKEPAPPQPEEDK